MRRASLLLAGILVTTAAQAADITQYNVVWDSPSRDASGTMPIGNGDVAASVYALADGDLHLLLAKNDAYTYQGDLFKTGRVRISLSPNPFANGKAFRQTLDLSTGSIHIEAAGVVVRIWVDANRPVCHVQIEAPEKVSVRAWPEFWQRFDRCPFNVGTYTDATPKATDPSPTQDVRLKRNGSILWYYAAGNRSIQPDDLRYYQVESMADRVRDPFRHNTFGNLLGSPDLKLEQESLIGTGTTFDLRIHAWTMQTAKPETWIEAIERQAARPLDVDADWRRHCDWWRAFWQRGWIVASDRTLPGEERGKLLGEPSPSGARDEEDGAALVAQSYNVFRYLMACQSRGLVQTKFNGGLFTQQLRVPPTDKASRLPRYPLPDGTHLTHEDDRLWGRRFTFQNQRLLYWPLLASGDFDVMKPFFDYYWQVLPMRRAITKAWFGHDGAYYRENIEPNGAERDCGKDGRPPKTKPGETYEGWYHDYYFTSGLEILAMMLDYVRYSGDIDFRDRVVAPFARDVIQFFDCHYQREQARLRLAPSQVLETWWVAVDPAPDVAGLLHCLAGLLATSAGTADDRANWTRLRAELPPVPRRTIDGREAIAPAALFDKKRNAENGELYPVFPFSCFGYALGTAELVDWTVRNRTCKDAFGCACWTQDQIHWALAGNAPEAAEGLVRRFRVASKMCRFPLFGREGPDSCPDFDHFGAGSVALQRMLVQEGDGKIFLLPAWPADWDVDFRLHLPGKTVIAGEVKDGRLVGWTIEPASRRGQVTVCQPQAAGPPKPLVPQNDYPVRAGADQKGGSRFRGTIGRISLFRGRLSTAAIRELATGDRTQAAQGASLIGSWLNPKPGQALTTAADDLAGPITLEAWLLPTENESGRIIDKLTAGKSDGVLFDTHPGLSLRLIAGDKNRHAARVLKPGAWQHVAFVLDRAGARLYIDGQPVP